MHSFDVLGRDMLDRVVVARFGHHDVRSFAREVVLAAALGARRVDHDDFHGRRTDGADAPIRLSLVELFDRYEGLLAGRRLTKGAYCSNLFVVEGDGCTDVRLEGKMIDSASV